MEVAFACAAMLGESPCWSVREQALWWVDIRAPSLHRLSAEGAHRQWKMPALCCAVAPARRGVVVALGNRLAWFAPDTGALEEFVTVEPAETENRLNEMKCDRRGDLWVGSMRDFGLAVTGALYRVSPDGAVARVLSGIRVPNSLGWSPDGGTLYFADTGEGRVRRYAVNCETGLPGAEGTLLAAADCAGRPDGLAVDCEGYAWNARPGAGIVVRIAPDGRVAETLELPVSHPTACALGGADLRTLYVTTARQRLSPDELGAQPLAGHLFAARVPVPGLVEPEFGGPWG